MTDPNISASGESVSGEKRQKCDGLVYEYDGASKCVKCGATWGAITDPDHKTHAITASPPSISQPETPKLSELLLDTVRYGSRDERDEAAKDLLELFRQQQEEIERLNRRLNEWQETEASVCPEDWGFAEYIKHLETTLNRTAKELLTAKATISGPSDSDPK